jgi:hypothetical protein
MFCPSCGKPEQVSDNYCRGCGKFVLDPSSNLSIFNRIFGISNPEKQLNFTLAVDLITAIGSGFLLFSLMGYFDAVFERTGLPTPPIVYAVYFFLGCVAAWQLLSFTVGTTYKRKLSASRKASIPPGTSQAALNESSRADAVYPTITEQTTRNLDEQFHKVGSKRQ